MKAGVAAFALSFFLIPVVWSVLDLYLLHPGQPLKWGREGTLLVGSAIAAIATLLSAIGFAGAALLLRRWLMAWRRKTWLAAGVGGALVMLLVAHSEIWVPLADVTMPIFGNESLLNPALALLVSAWVTCCITLGVVQAVVAESLGPALSRASWRLP